MNFIFKGILKLLGKEWMVSSEAYANLLRKHGVKVGKNFYIAYGEFPQSGAPIIDYTRPSLLEIGDNVRINQGFRLYTHDFVTGVFRVKYAEFLPSSGAVKIGNNVAFGANVTVLKGVTIGDNCFIGANSVVSRSIPANSLAVGNPARVVCSIDEYFERRLVKCEEEAFAYAKSIVERYGRRPKVSDFYEEFPLFVDSHNIDEYIDVLPIRRQLDVYYDRWIKNHKAKYDGFEEFLIAAGIK